MSLDSYVTLGRSGLRVSPFTLGTMTFGEDWGWGSSPEESARILASYVDRGGNSIDTANVYTNGHSEKIIGDYLDGRSSLRDRVVLGTKFFGNLHEKDPNGGGPGRKAIVQQLEARLRTDHVDVYWLHNFDPATPVEQYETLRARDVEVALTVGPWTHLTVDNKIAMPEAISWLDTHAAGRGPVRREAPVRVFVGGAGRWEDHQAWPPEARKPRTWYLRTGQRLAESASTEDSGGTRFRYDPAEPTPSIGGRVMAISGGAKDNRKLEARDDVLVFTTEPLTRAVEVHGAPNVELHVTSDNAEADLFARICDVDPAGRSVNVTDRIVRCTDQDTVPGVARTVRITLDPTAHRFEVGHRIRLQISGGAFPRFARNLGTGETPGAGTTVRPTTHTVHHSAGQVSRISLPTRE